MSLSIAMLDRWNRPYLQLSSVLPALLADLVVLSRTPPPDQNRTCSRVRLGIILHTPS